MTRFKILLLLTILGLPLIADAQSFYGIRRNRSLIVSGGIGNSSYFGDLKDAKEYLDPRVNINGGLQYFFTNRISVRTELGYVRLKANDANSSDPSRVKRNLSFQSNNIEFTATGAINLLPLGQRFYQRPNINAYAFLGVGLLYTNPKAELDGKKYALKPLETEGVSYSRLQFVIPYGLGVRMKAGPFFNVAIEGGYRMTFTDYLDDVSTTYPDPTSFSDPIAAQLSMRYEDPVPAGTQRGDPSHNDGYFLLNLKVEFYLPKNFLFDDNQRKLYNTKRKSYYRRRR